MTSEEFKNLFLPHAAALQRAAWRLTAQTEEAEDLVQETLLLLWNKRQALHSVSNAEAYAIATLRNVYCSALRRQNVPTSGLEEARHAEAPAAKEVADDLRLLIDSLPEPGRTVLILRELEETSYDDIAHTLGMTPGNVRVALCRARRKLRELWERDI